MAYKFLNKIYKGNRSTKIFLQILCDLIIIFFSLLFALYLRTDHDFLKYFSFRNQFLPLSILSVAFFYLINFYRNILRYLSLHFLKKIILASLFSSFLLAVSALFLENIIPRSIPFIYFFILLFSLSISRLLIINLYFLLNKEENKNRIAIFGAGKVGKELAFNLVTDEKNKLVCFIDDNSELHNLYILSVPVISRERSLIFLQSNKIKNIFIAINNLEKNIRKEIFEYYSEYNLTIQVLPSFSNMINKNLSVSNLRHFEITDLLGRDPVKPQKNLFKKNLMNKTILITGAGGSIGSELCNQIISNSPKKIILLDSNEFALYKIFEKLTNLKTIKKFGVEIRAILSNMSDQKQLDKIFKTEKIDLLYHAAAYKHVSFVEQNFLEAFKNNVLYTLNLIEIAVKNKILKFTLISTDKAVNPTSIMGATKRVTEIISQYYSIICPNTIFSIVRFGNVLGSSGSVIPKFQEAIDNKNHINVTHREATRFFMLISEASQLVIHASSIAKKGEIFILDMGKPVKIIDLAILMIKLSGYKPIIKTNSQAISKDNHSIEIRISKLGSGEKIHEELYTNSQLINTNHSLIKYEKNSITNTNEIERMISNLKKFILQHNEKEIKKIIKNKIINFKNVL